MIDYKGHVYHVYNRGVGKQRIFTGDKNYLFLISRMKDLVATHQVSILAYCLMPNHYHFLLRSDKDREISRFVRNLFNGYAQAYNRQEGRSGTLFESRAKSKRIESDSQLLQVIRYIHLNPLKAKLVQRAEDWPYSNLPEWLGVRAGKLYDYELANQLIPTPEDYRRFLTQSPDKTAIQELVFD